MGLMSLRPMDREFFVDDCDILFAIGLLAEVSQAKALRIMKRYLRKM
jgi:hypothetical protein